MNARSAPLRRAAGLVSAYMSMAGHGPVDLPALAIEFLARTGQAKDARPALDQALARLLLEPAERVADRGLFKAQARTGGGETAFLRDHHEGAQQVPAEFPSKAVEPAG
jgi:hypothetical protein